MKTILILSAALACASATATPTLVADPYPVGPTQAETASLSVDGGVAIPCIMNLSADGALQPMCDLASITVPGVYKLVMIVSNREVLTNETGGTFVVGGAAKSAPFTYTYRSSIVLPTGAKK